MIRRTILQSLIAFALTSACASTIADTSQTVSQPEHAVTSESSGTYFQNAYPVADHVHVLRQGEGVHAQGIGNVTVVEQADGLVLVDAGGTPGAGRRVVKLVRELSAKPVKAIVITHWHGDHHFGLSEVLAAWPPAMVICTEQTLAHMNNRGLPAAPDATYDATQLKRFEATRADMEKASRDGDTPPPQRELYAQEATEVAQYEEDFKGASIRYAKMSFSERISLPDDVAPVEVMYLGKANTDGDAIAWLPKQKVIATGDTVVAPVPYGAGTYPAEWVQVLKKIAAYDFAVLIPGHGVPELDKTYVLKLISALEDLQAQVKPLVKKGLTLEEITKKVDFTKGEKSLAGPDPWFVDWMQGYWEPVVDCIYAEEKKLPIVQGKGCKQ